MARLSSPLENIKAHYDVVVVGSGYGGAIAASRMARAGQQVCLLERGKEFQPGDYPNSLRAAAPEMQADMPQGHIGCATGLYSFYVNPDMNVFQGCGLGGTSLVNANVSLRPEPRVFEDARWPQELLTDGLLEEGYRHAEEMLEPAPYPNDQPQLAKLQALEACAASLKQPFYRPPINVTFRDGLNHAGVFQRACNLCGDCVSGCNIGGKNTLAMNYLPDASAHGAELYTEVRVRHVERREGNWVVYYQPLGTARERFDAPELFVTAETVILSASSLGSTEILLRSREKGLPLSDELGRHFTGNGDFIGFGYNTDREVNAMGMGTQTPDKQDPVGPCITGIIDMRNQAELNDGIIVEEGSPPGALAVPMPEVLTAIGTVIGKDTDPGFKDRIDEKFREWQSLLLGARHGATRNTVVYLVDAHDDGNGRMYLQDDRLRIEWTGVGGQPVFTEINERLELFTKALGGTYVMNPLASKLLGNDLVTVHPLGGCAMARDAEHGVVNHKGQVFSGAQGKAVHEGLYVADGAVMPRPLGVNPLLAISALAERTCALLAKDRGWKIDYTLPSGALPVPESPKLGIQFTETMRGYLSTSVLDGYQEAATQGKQHGSPCEFTLTIASDDLDTMLEDQDHLARIVGSVLAPAISPQPMMATEGDFSLLTEDPEATDTRQMRYRMKMTSEAGRQFYFEGFKVVHSDPGPDLWADTTTLYVTVHDGDNSHGPVIGKGILTIDAVDFMRQMTTMQVSNAPGVLERLEATARFGRFFAGTLYDVYGSVFAGPKAFNADAPPREKRPLRVNAPEVHHFRSADGLQLRLTRYRGGPKGPVMLSHGLGVSSKIFSIDTIETNLLEYLWAQGYDVWLLDYRASIDLPVSNLKYSADDIATKDYPAAVATIRRITGADTIQAVVHCYGSASFFLAMLSGLQGVRSAVCSQIGTHVVVPQTMKVMSGLHFPEALSRLGVDSLTAYVDNHANWLDRLYDRALSLYPTETEERCTSASCHRISFLYSPLYEHDQLNEATHDALHEMFGVANIVAFEHLAAMARAGHLVSVSGADVYLPHLQRLAIPIAFIHGAENKCFMPRATELAYEALVERNGAALYSRHVIPNYGHIDCIFGKNAVNDVYPFILEHLEKTAGYETSD